MAGAAGVCRPYRFALIGGGVLSLATAATGLALPLVVRELISAVGAGGMTAFVGPSGAGKTTVFSLIERFYEPDAGRVLVDGVDVRDWALGELRAAIGYAEQDAPVLSGTLRENLLYGAPDASEEDLADVLRTARLDVTVARLPDGLDTTVGHRGMKLSGGERQRVAIARALVVAHRLSTVTMADRILRPTPGPGEEVISSSS